ncbi:MAG: ABC transporter ATP-binding protein, partial [Anaerolineales bacterium]
LSAGTVLAVIGPNGIGKTTLFKTLTGELAPIRGSVVIEELGKASQETAECESLAVKGKIFFWHHRVRDKASVLSVRSLEPRIRARIITRVLQNEKPAWAVSVRDYIEAGLYSELGLFGKIAGKTKCRIDEAIETMELQKLAERYVTTLSGGEFRRVVLARALAQDTRIVLFDEPTSDLDLSHQMDVLHLMRKLAGARKAVAFSVHDLNFAAMAADQIILLADGKVAGFGTPSAVLTAETIASAYGAKVLVREHPLSGLPTILHTPDWLSEMKGKLL